MKKLFFACAILLGSMGMYACSSGNEGTTETEQSETGTMENTGTMDTDTSMMQTDTTGTIQ